MSVSQTISVKLVMFLSFILATPTGEPQLPSQFTLGCHWSGLGSSLSGSWLAMVASHHHAGF